MKAPWHRGEEPQEDADGVAYYFMSSLAQLCPHVSLTLLEEQLTRHDWRRASAENKLARVYSNYKIRLVSRQETRRFMQLISYYLVPCADMPDGASHRYCDKKTDMHLVYTSQKDDYRLMLALAGDTNHNTASLMIIGLLAVGGQR